METNSKQRAAGFVKNKLVSTFYKTSKPPAPLPITAPYGGGGAIINKTSYPASSMKKVPSLTKLTNLFGGSDDYVHGPSGGGGDAKVDIRASNYISSFKERLILEERNATNERVEMFRRN
ncbi:hypothetical protein Lser_V15G14581 [Lactuca serriola]|uniref:Uncharacterized protein n=1 Tax=Lactuca sativa TaxID=4236 RepID=A0A9R1VX34_LACSA|nr:hypothetical protein LSAT_V11C400157800 [Lactuca sativa]